VNTPSPRLLAGTALVLLALLGTAALAAAAEPAMTGPQLGAGPRGQDRPAAIVIDSISPDIAVPGKRVTVSGWVRNNTPASVVGLEVQLWSSGSRFTERGQFDSFVSGVYQVERRIPGAAVQLPALVGRGQTVRWRASFRANQVGIRAFGVYPLAAALVNSAGAQVAVERTFLPFWPGRGAVMAPLKIAWIWPLIDRPHRGVCSALLDNRLPASLAGGRLAGLLGVGRRYAAAARLTWAVDPALLDDVSTLTRPYRLLTGARCWQNTGRDANAAAKSWLTTLRAVTATQPVLATPYADPDVAALSHRGLDPDLRAALRVGAAVAARFVDRTDSTTAWPPGGIADAGVLENILAAGGSVKSGSLHGGIQTVVLDSAIMPPANPLFYTPDAVTRVHTGLGKAVRVLLADHELSATLATAASADGAATADVATATSQRFLAETAMIAAEAPNLPRSVVVAPPRRWDPGATVASKLIADTVSAPWLRPVYLGKLKPAVTPPGVPAAQRVALPARQAKGELSARYVRRVRDLGERARLFSSILSHPTDTYQRAILRLESSAWRGRNQARGRSLIRQADAEIGDQERRVSIIPSSQVTLGGNRGSVPVSIENRLPQAVRVRLQATVTATRAVPAAQRLAVISPPGKLVTIGPHQTETFRLQVRAHSAGLAEIRLRLLNAAGRPLPGGDRTLTIRSTAFGTLAMVIIAVALGVLVITFAARLIRNAIRDGRPGTVVAEGNRTDDNGLAEAPDELADARGGAAERDSGP